MRPQRNMSLPCNACPTTAFGIAALGYMRGVPLPTLSRSFPHYFCVRVISAMGHPTPLPSVSVVSPMGHPTPLPTFREFSALFFCSRPMGRPTRDPSRLGVSRGNSAAPCEGCSATPRECFRYSLFSPIPLEVLWDIPWGPSSHEAYVPLDVP